MRIAARVTSEGTIIGIVGQNDVISNFTTKKVLLAACKERNLFLVIKSSIMMQLSE